MSDSPEPIHRRRVRYSGKNPRRFEDKYKEFDPAKYPEAVAKVLASGKTPAGMHRSIMVEKILEVLAPRSGEIAVDCTLGYGGHAREIMNRLRPGGKLIGLDVDPIEQPKTEARLREAGFEEDIFVSYRSNFAGLPRALSKAGVVAVDCLLADLGVSSMQIDTPTRGFSLKESGPLDMRMNPQKGQSARALLEQISRSDLEDIFRENADEPKAGILSSSLAGRKLETTVDLAQAIRAVLHAASEEEVKKTTRRVFQALRIAVNEEFVALDTLLSLIPQSLKPGGRVAILTFHSGEDRRVKKAFQAGLQAGLYSRIAPEVLRPSAEECRANSRASSAKLRWAQV